MTNSEVSRGMVDGFVGNAGIKSGYRQLCCRCARAAARMSCRQHNFASVKIAVAASTYDKNAQIDKPLCLY
jgi:hypothetical protein